MFNYVNTMPFLFFLLIGITHAEIIQLAIIRSVRRFFYDTRLSLNDAKRNPVNAEEYFATEHAIDDLYELVYPEYNRTKVRTPLLTFIQIYC